MSTISTSAALRAATSLDEQRSSAIDASAERPLTTADRCDACGAQAFIRVVLASGELLFCGHHGRRNMTSLEKQALFIQDETSRLTADG